MSTARFRIRRGESSPDISSGVGTGDQRLNRERDGSNESAVDETILPVP